MKKLVDKDVQVNLNSYKDSLLMLEVFEAAARYQGWSDTEIALALNQTKGQSLSGKFEILQGYCLTYGDNAPITQEDVIYMLDHLGFHTHYLANKLLSTWDEYDWSNYTSLRRKATSAIHRVFGLFCTSVLEQDKYSVTSPPKTYFDTLEEAKNNIPKGKESTTKIYSLWVNQ